MKNFAISPLIFLFLAEFSCGQILSGSAAEMYQKLESRLNSMNSSLAQQQKQADALAADLLLQEYAHDTALKSLKSSLTTAQDKITALEKTVKDNGSQLKSHTEQILAAELQILELSTRLERLRLTNELWRSNFQVVNRTFADLRKKLPFVIPKVGF